MAWLTHPGNGRVARRPCARPSGTTSGRVDLCQTARPRDLEPREADATAECGRGRTVAAARGGNQGRGRTGYRRKFVWAGSPCGQ
jgi:hypothetical protein